MHTASVPLISADPGLLAAVTMSSLDAFSSINPDYFLSVSLIADTDDQLALIMKQ